MTPERWQQVKALFQSALEGDSRQRAAFLDEACAGDAALRTQVEALVASHEGAPGFLEAPAIDVAPTTVEDDEAGSMIGQRIGPYEVLHEIGRGGMGEVYLAQDKRLGRQVALKFLPVFLQHDPDRRARLLTEARAASLLHSPHIATVHDIGEHQGRAYIVMEYVEGEPLSRKLKGGPLPLEKGIDIATQVAEALEEAHACGIIHRDIKSSNLVVTPRGQVKVLDFGLAKVTQHFALGKAEEETTITKRLETASGIVMGTVHYMSPEQARGLSVDARSDLFSLGVVLYEMVTGRVPFEGETNSDVMVGILEREPEPLARWRPEVPPELERIVRQCLEKDRQRRYQSAQELLSDLSNVKLHAGEDAAVAGRPKTSRIGRVAQRWFLAAAILMSALAVFAYVLRFRSAPPGIPSFTKSLAVLPLENLSGDPKQEFLSDGMTDALIANLAQIATLKVISRTSIMQYKRARRPLREIAKELNVGAVLEGTVLSVGDRVRITAQLIEADTERHLWVKNYESDLSDILRLQSEVARAAAQEIQVMLTSSEKAKLARFRPVNRDAYEAYLRGLVESNKEHLEKAISLDPDFAPAYSGLARLYYFDAFGGAKAPRDALPRVRELAQTALQKDEALAEAHAWLAMVHLYYDWDWTRAEKEYRIALDLNPGSGEVRDYYAHFLLAMNRIEEAVAESKRAMELNPLDVILISCVSWHSFYSRQYDQMIEHSLKALAIEPNNGFALWAMGLAYEQKSMFKEAIAAFKKIGDTVDLGHAFAASGDKGPAREALSELNEQRAKGYVSAYTIALIHHCLGNNERAFEWLETAYRERSVDLIHLNADPRLDALRPDPRFQDLIKRIKFPV